MAFKSIEKIINNDVFKTEASLQFKEVLNQG